MAKVKSKLPLRKIICDDFKFTDAESGKDFYPHVGETVTFSRKTTISDMAKLMRFQSLAGKQQADAIVGEPNSDTTLEFADALESLIDLLFDSLVSWEWTDDDDEPYPTHPTRDVVASLSVEEIVFLVGMKVNSGKRTTDDDVKNG